jgi:hypothetical protein
MTDFNEALDRRVVLGAPRQPQPGGFEEALRLEKALANVSREKLDTREGQAQYCATLGIVINDIHEFVTIAEGGDELLAPMAKADVERYIMAAKIMAQKLCMAISAKG